MNSIIIYESTGDMLDAYSSHFVPRIGDQVQIGATQYFVREVICLIPHKDQPEEIRIVVESNVGDDPRR